MEYFRNTTDFSIETPSVVSVGKFDGLHAGHRTLVAQMLAEKEHGLTTVALTFASPIRTGEAGPVPVITTNPEKEAIFAEAGIDVLIELPLSEKLMHMSPERFLDFLTGRICVRTIVAGSDFHFGYRRSGNPQTLIDLADRYGYKAVIVDKVQDGGRDISSTRIRAMIEAGDMAGAQRLLGYPYFIEGTVLHGNALGRTVGIPTANLSAPPEKILPPFGGYITRVRIGDEFFGGITNIGRKPTVGDHNAVGIETNIFDFDRDIYGEKIRVYFYEFLREEKKYDSFEALRAQMEQDVAYAKERLKKAAGNRIYLGFTE